MNSQANDHSDSIAQQLIVESMTIHIGATQHQAIHDVYDSDFERESYRVTLNGSIPVGVDGQPSTPISGEPITPIQG